MTTLILLARAVHVIAGIMWAGVAFVLITAIAPIGRQYAQEGAERWTGLIARKIGPMSGVAAMLTIISGGYLMAILHRGDSTWGGTVLKLGAAAAVAALIVGIAVARPAALKLAALASRATDAQVQQQMAQLRQRAAVSTKLTGLLVALAVLSMALFRYVDVLR